MNIEALKEAHDLSLDGRDFAARQIILDVIASLEKEALSEPEQKYHRGDRLICLETEEYCVIHISGTDRQWVKFPDSHIGVYTNEQVAELFELLPKEPEPVAWEQFYPDIGKPKFVAQPEQEPVGSLSVRYHRGCKSMTNTDFDYNGNLPEGDYELYTTPPQPEFAIGDIRALRHRIHELEGEVIGYKQILDAQPGQEPVDFDAIIADIEAISCRYQGDPSHDHCPYKIRSESADTVRRHASYYTIPPQREWVGLTDDDRNDLWWTTDIMKLTQAIEAKLRSKNT